MGGKECELLPELLRKEFGLGIGDPALDPAEIASKRVHTIEPSPVVVIRGMVSLLDFVDGQLFLLELGRNF